MRGFRIVSSGITSLLVSLWQKIKYLYLWQPLPAKLTIKRMHLLDLNDDCLRDIMSFLNDDDLCSVAEYSSESSIRLKDIATEAFRRSWRSRKITNSNKMEVKIYERRVFQFEHFRSVILEDVLTCTHLRELTISCFRQNVTQFIHDLNSLTSLTILRLYSVHGDLEFVPALAKLKQLRILSLIFCEVNDLNPLNDLDKLEHLYIRKLYGSEKLELDIVRLVKRLRNLYFLHVSPNIFQLDKETYLRLVDEVREEARVPLYLGYAVHKDVADAQNTGLNRHIVHALGLD